MRFLCPFFASRLHPPHPVCSCLFSFRAAFSGNLQTPQPVTVVSLVTMRPLPGQPRHGPNTDADAQAAGGVRWLSSAIAAALQWLATSVPLVLAHQAMASAEAPPAIACVPVVYESLSGVLAADAPALVARELTRLAALSVAVGAAAASSLTALRAGPVIGCYDVAAAGAAGLGILSAACDLVIRLDATPASGSGSSSGVKRQTSTAPAAAYGGHFTVTERVRGLGSVTSGSKGRSLLQEYTLAPSSSSGAGGELTWWGHVARMGTAVGAPANAALEVGPQPPEAATTTTTAAAAGSAAAPSPAPAPQPAPAQQAPTAPPAGEVALHPRPSARASALSGKPSQPPEEAEDAVAAVPSFAPSSLYGGLAAKAVGFDAEDNDLDDDLEL